MKLALKLSLFLVVGMCVVLALDSLIGIRRELRLHVADMQQDQHVTGRVLARAFAEQWGSQGREHALAFVDRANRESGRTYLRWIEFGVPAGSPRAPQLPRTALGSVEHGHELQQSAQPPGAPERFFTYVPVTIDGAIQGALELSEPVESARYVRATLVRRIATAAVFGGLSGLIAVLLGAVLVGRPIRSLVQKTRRIAAGDFSRPLDLHQHDEIGEVAREIDTMCDQLARARERIVTETAARIRAIEQLRHTDRLATVGKLASGVAHELGTPLNVASQRAKMIATGEVSGAEAAAGARIIAEQAQRMTAVVRQLLDFARVRSPHKERYDLGAVARQTVTLLSPLGARRGVTLRVDEAETQLLAEVDAAQIQQALTNLVVNGIQAMEKGGELSIEIEARTVRAPADLGGQFRRCLVLSVRDQGSGVRPEDLPHLFEPFFTTKDVGEGTGLGLAVAYGIVRDHGGWIDLESSLGRGSCFSIVLPCSGEPEPPIAAPVPAFAAEASAAESNAGAPGRALEAGRS